MCELKQETGNISSGSNKISYMNMIFRRFRISIEIGLLNVAGSITPHRPPNMCGTCNNCIEVLINCNVENQIIYLIRTCLDSENAGFVLQPWIVKSECALRLVMLLRFRNAFFPNVRNGKWQQ